MKSNEAGTPRNMTIDAAGNIVPKPYGSGRWASPRKYTCAHDDCDEASIRVSTDGGVHNCCGIWHHEESENVMCDCMTEDPNDGFGERVVTHSLGCPLHPDYDGELS